MIRRFGAVLLGLALTLPLSLSVATAHTSGGIVLDYDLRAADGAIVGTVANHTTSRRTISITATWDGTPTDVSATVQAFASSVAPHASSPFAIAEPPAAAGLPLLSVTASSTTNSTNPVGGLHLGDPSLVAGVLTVNITNDASVTANDVELYAVRMNGAVFTDGAKSAAADLAAGANANFTITFDGDSDGNGVAALIAKTTAGQFITSWNNFFGDLGTSAFSAEIAWMADNGITLGCTASTFCPKSNVTREQMAVFLYRALGLSPATGPHPFTDIGDSFAEAEIAAVYEAGITTGCTATTFCPTGTVTREQMAAFLDRGYVFPAVTSDPFTDDETSFAESHINDMAATAVTTGCTATTFCPKALVNREQMAAFIFRAEAWAAAQP